MCSPQGLSILSQTECEYFATLLVKQPTDNEAASNSEEESVDLEFYFERARNTVQVLNDNLVKPEVPTAQFFEFYRDSTVMNVVKLLMRGKQLYEDRAEATKILRLVTEIELILKPKQLVWRFL